MSAKLTNHESETKNSTQSFLSGKLAQVDIKKIEKELQSLWRMAASSDNEQNQDSSSLSVTRACVMNFILYSEEDASMNAASDLLDGITLRHPCRAILCLDVESDTGSNLEAWVSARCHISDTNTMKQICCEQITVHGEGVKATELSSVVLPLIVPDLPVVMWWQPSRMKADRLAPFVESVDKIIFDSGNEPQNLEFFQELLKVLHKASLAEHGRILLVTDLNWRRGLPWRESLALAFDRRHSEITPDYLPGIKSVEIRYGVGDAPESSKQSGSGSGSDKTPNDGRGLNNQALLIAGWLSSTLKWRLQSAATTGTTSEFVFDNAGKAVSLKLIGVKAEEADLGDIGSVEIRCQKPKAITITAIQRRGMPGIGVTFLPEGEKPEERPASMFELNEVSEERLIDKELEVLAREASFLPAVTATVSALQALASSCKTATGNEK